MSKMSGQEVIRYDISAMTNASPCVVTTSETNEFATGNFVRLTDLNGSIPIQRGMDPINNKRFKVTVIDDNNFSLQWPITNEDVDSTNYTPYVTGGYCTLVQDEFIYEGD